MLLNFEIENWACFKNTATLSMEAGPEQSFSGRLAAIGAPSRPLRILPCAAIYGNNASGKSQLVRALSFLKTLVVDGYKGTVPVAPFALDGDSASRPTRFRIQFVVSENVYDLEVSLTAAGVMSETLVAYSTRSRPKETLYKRVGDNVSECNLGDKEFAAVVKRMNMENGRLFLSIAGMLLHDDVRVNSIYNWFYSSLQIVFPESFYIGVDNLAAKGPIHDATLRYLNAFDIGIKAVETEPVELPSPGNGPDAFGAFLRPGQVVRFGDGHEVYQADRDDGNHVTLRRLKAIHEGPGGRPTPFSFGVESDGTRRMLDLIPIVCNRGTPEAPIVVVVDEIDRSLHHLVCRRLVSDFLNGCGVDTRAQLAFTTHDLLMMDGDLCRRDEMWIVEKSPDGESSLTDVASFRNVRKGSNIADLYLDGRLGGVPRGI